MDIEFPLVGLLLIGQTEPHESGDYTHIDGGIFIESFTVVVVDDARYVDEEQQYQDAGSQPDEPEEKQDGEIVSAELLDGTREFERCAVELSDCIFGTVLDACL